MSYSDILQNYQAADVEQKKQLNKANAANTAANQQYVTDQAASLAAAEKTADATDASYLKDTTAANNALLTNASNAQASQTLAAMPAAQRALKEALASSGLAGSGVAAVKQGELATQAASDIAAGNDQLALQNLSNAVAARQTVYGNRSSFNNNALNSQQNTTTNAWNAGRNDTTDLATGLNAVTAGTTDDTASVQNAQLQQTLAEKLADQAEKAAMQREILSSTIGAIKMGA